MRKQQNRINPNELADLLNHSRLTDADIARTWGVSRKTVINWRKAGVTGCPAHLIRVLHMLEQVPIRFVAERLGIQLKRRLPAVRAMR
jgi:hypothetical protein